MPNRPSAPSPDQFNPGLSNTSQSFKNPFTLTLVPGTAWVLQVADFKANSDARLLIHHLREKGFKAYTRQITLSTGLVGTRVFVGPEIKLEQLKNIAVRLNKEMQLKSTMETAFDPLLLSSSYAKKN